MFVIGHLITALYVLWIVSGMVRWRALGKGMRVVVVYLGIALVSTGVTYWMGRSNINNLWVLHLYTLFSTLLLLRVFVIWEKHPAVRGVMSGSAFFFAAIWVLSKLFLEDFALFDSFTMPLAAVLLVSAAVRTLYSITDSTEHSVVRDARFWVAVGVIIECCTTVLSFSAGNLLLADRKAFLSFFELYWIASVVYLVCYGAAMFSRHSR